MQRQFSAGATIFYEGKRGREYLLIQDGYGHWVFPKGVIEKGETSLEGAKREIFEETGLKDTEFIAGFKEESQFIFTFEAELILKKVTWYLAKSKTKRVKISKEHQAYKWSKLRSALKLMDIKDNQELLKKADEFLDIPRLI
jgi:bis(5'-nucleosidyl)-tetraphosphatase